MSSTEFTVYFGNGVADVMQEAQRMIREARSWVAGAGWLDTYVEGVIAQDELYRLQRKLEADVNEMELSWFRSLNALTNMASQSGEMRLSWDSENSLFFHEPKGGLCGALIFFANHHKGERTIIGT